MNFYENNIILWHYQIRPKSGLESGAWIDGYDYQNKDKKNITSAKKKICYFFVQCIIAKTM